MFDPYYRARRARREAADFVTARRLALQSQCRPAPWQCPKCDAWYASAGCPVCDAIAEAWAKRVSLPAIKPGDTIFHRPTGETWVVRDVQGEYLSWCGWPPGRAWIADCELVEETRDEPPPSGWRERPALL